MDGKDGSEDLLGHDGAVRAGLFDEGGLEVQLVMNYLATVEGLSPVLLLVEALQPLEVVGVVYLSVVSRFYEILTPKGQFHLNQQDFLEFFVDAFMGIDVIYSHACLPAI